MPTSLSELLAPVPAEDFLSTFWLKSYLLCRGRPDRFSGLLSWPELNRILEHHWRETFRFRLALHGRDLEPSSYANLDGATPRIRSKDLTDHLRRGATLAFHAADEVHEPLRQLAESFEARFRGSTKINVYAAWRAAHGLDLHRDDQEIFILHLDGRKRWLLYGPSIDHLGRASSDAMSVAPDGWVLDHVLEAGDVLYIPKGCYHIAVPMNEPALHLTVSVKDPGSRFNSRPSFNLPWSATPGALPLGHDFDVRVHRPSQLRFESLPAGRGVELRLGTRVYRLPRGLQLVFDELGDSSLPFRVLVDRLAGRLDEPAVRLIVEMAIKEDLVCIASPSECSSPSGPHSRR